MNRMGGAWGRRVLLPLGIMFFPLLIACRGKMEQGRPEQTESAGQPEVSSREAGPAAKENPMKQGIMEFTSTAFADGAVIPVRHTCDGEDLSPPLSWEGAPAATKCYALICDDPDAPMGTWDHWLLYNIPAGKTMLPAGMPDDARHPDGTLSGRNSWKRTGYGGPCPPPGKPHRYFFRIYALSAPVDLPEGANKRALLDAIRELTLATGTLMGTYGR